MKTSIKILLVIFTFAFFSCQKNDIIEPAADLSASQLKSATIAVNDVAVESVSEEVNYETYFYSEYEQMLRGFARMNGSNGNLLSGMGNMHYMNGQTPIVKIDTAAMGYPMTITVDYGTSTETQRGMMMSGKVVIELSGPKNVDGSMRTTTYVGCVIDSIGISGTSKETFSGNNTTTRKMTTISDVTFTLADGTVIHRVGNSMRDWMKGLDTPLDRDDDMMQITGTINVTSSTGDTYSREITDPLIRLGDCNYPVQGKVQYTKNGSELAMLDYGTGTCDNLANLTTNGTTIEITLKDHHMPTINHSGNMNGGNMGNNGNMGGNRNMGGNGNSSGSGTSNGNTTGTGSMNGSGNNGGTSTMGGMNGMSGGGH